MAFLQYGRRLLQNPRRKCREKEILMLSRLENDKILSVQKLRAKLILNRD